MPVSNTTANSPFKTKANEYRQRVDLALAHWLPKENSTPTHLHAAMRYAVIGGGGKRVRPILVYAAGHTVGIAAQQLDGIASALEIIHAYSLIHDDLPAMDDDDLRRGRPTCHKAYDEATAILAGDALQALAFEIICNDKAMQADASTRIRLIQELTVASGSLGMAGGQAVDLAAVGKSLTLTELEEMHRLKTGALIRASVRMGAINSNECDQQILSSLDQYSQYVGLAFQVQDDILDVISDTDTLGKPQGSDIARNKPTFPELMGLEASQKYALELHQQALDSLQDFDQRADTLRQLSAYIVERRN
ncbi:MAG: (2E,6E)-farnesyl diphosphate synthase [Gammaproteobacteria bacterium]|nr:(2E,6E)-farnesyl diphosphate synthase [Gammaproteobacteria bacterium]